MDSSLLLFYHKLAHFPNRSNGVASILVCQSYRPTDENFRATEHGSGPTGCVDPGSGG